MTNKISDSIEIKDAVAIRHLSDGRQIIVDKEDASILYRRDWHINSSGYAISGYLSVHREVMRCPKGFKLEVHHKNENKLDCRKDNLQFVTHQQNHCLGTIRNDNTSGHKGVTFQKDTQTWQAQIGVFGRNIYLGTFQNKEDAIIARKLGENKYHVKP